MDITGVSATAPTVSASSMAGPEADTGALNRVDTGRYEVAVEAVGEIESAAKLDSPGAVSRLFDEMAVFDKAKTRTMADFFQSVGPDGEISQTVRDASERAERLQRRAVESTYASPQQREEALRAADLQANLMQMSANTRATANIYREQGMFNMAMAKFGWSTAIIKSAYKGFNRVVNGR